MILRSKMAVSTTGKFRRAQACGLEWYHLRGVTLVELLLVYALLAIGLAFMVGVSDYVQREAKSRLAEEMVVMLREALLKYDEVAGRFPAGGADEAIAAMLNEESSARILEDWPIASTKTSPASRRFVDPWSRPFRYVTAKNSEAAGHGGSESKSAVPVFVSAGADGDFGDTVSGARQDNVSSDIAMIIRAAGE